MGDSRPPSNKSDGSDAALRIVLPPSRTPSANSAESEVAPPVKPDVSLKAVDMPPQIDKIEEIKPIETAVAVSPALVPKSSKNLTGKTLTSGSSKMSKSKEKSAGGSQPPPLILMGPSGSQSASKRDGPRQQNSSSAQSSVIFPPPTGPFMLPPHFQSAYFNQQATTNHQTLIVNHYGQPVGIVSPIMSGPGSFVTNGTSTSNSQTSAVSNAGGPNASLMPRGPIMYAYRSSGPNQQGGGSLMGNSILSGSSHFSGIPSNAGFPSNTVVIRTPVGQLMGFQVTPSGNLVSTPFLGPSGSGFVPNSPLQSPGYNPTYQTNTTSSSTTVGGDAKGGNLPDISRGVPIFPHPQYPASSSGAPILPKPALMSNMALGVHHQVPSGYGLLKSQPTGVITKAGPCGADGKPKNSSDEEFSRCSRKTSSDYGASQLPKLEFVADDATRKSSSSDLDSINVSDSPPPVINIGLDSKRLKEETRADQDRLDRDSQSSEPPRLTPVNESSGELIVTDPGSIDEPQKSFGLTFDKKWLKREMESTNSALAGNLFFDQHDRSDIITATIDPHTLFMQEVERHAASKPDILVHLIDGFVIHESSEPFPVSPFPFDDFVTSAMMELAAPPELELVVDRRSEAEGSQIPPCAHCKRSTANGFYHRYPQFCSKSCWKKSSKEAARNQLSSDFGAKRPKLDLSPTKSDTSDRSKETEISTDSAQLPKSPSAFSPSSKSAISESSLPCSSVSTEAVVRQEPPPAVVAPANKNPSQWTVDEVYAFLLSLGPSVAAYAQMFRQQEIDGQALLLLHENHLMDSMGLKLGPALKLCAAVKDLKSARL